MCYAETNKDNCFSITEPATKIATIIHVEKDVRPVPGSVSLAAMQSPP